MRFMEHNSEKRRDLKRIACKRWGDDQNIECIFDDIERF
jgi:hypothetical protein